MRLGTAVKESLPRHQRVLDPEAQVGLGIDPAVAKPFFERIATGYLAKQIRAAKARTYNEDERYLL
jgi:hypothetical protein